MQAEVIEKAQSLYAKVRKILPVAPDHVEFEFDSENRYLIAETGTGGFAAEANKIIISYDPKFADKKRQEEDLIATVFHEGFHLAQGYNGERFNQDNPLSALDEAIYEGAATVFERERTGNNPPWGKYLDDETMQKWVVELSRLPLKYDWRKWKFLNPKTNERWIMYRTGAYIVDRALKFNKSLKIEDLVHKTPAEIIRLAELDKLLAK
jgi:hypothetical protein